MAVRKIMLGSVGPFYYDDADTIDDPDGDFAGEDQRALATDGQILIESPPVVGEETVRLDDMGGLVNVLTESKAGAAYLAALNARRDIDRLEANLIIKVQVFN